MTAQITIGAAAVMAALVGATGLVRWAVTPVREPGRHRAATTTAVLDEASLDELLGDWPKPAPGALVAQAWRWCPSCLRVEPSVLHADDCWRCGHCLQVTFAGGAV